jgi:hypothetical protein
MMKNIILSSLAVTLASVLFTGCSSASIFGTSVPVTKIKEGKIPSKYMCNYYLDTKDETLKTLIREKSKKALVKDVEVPNDDSIKIQLHVQEDIIITRLPSVEAPTKNPVPPYHDKEHLSDEKVILVDWNATRPARCKNGNYYVEVEALAKDKSGKTLFKESYKADINYKSCEHKIFRLPYVHKVYKKLKDALATKIADDINTRTELDAFDLETKLDVKLSSSQQKRFDKAIKLVGDYKVQDAGNLLAKISNELGKNQSYVILYNLGLIYEAMHEPNALLLHRKADEIRQAKGVLFKPLSIALHRLNHNQKVLKSLTCLYKKQ